MTQKYIHDVENDEVIVKDLTAAEIKDWKIQQSKEEQRLLADQTEAEAKAIAKQAILDRLGLTADEAKLLLG